MCIKWVNIWKYSEWCLLFIVIPRGTTQVEYPARSVSVGFLTQPSKYLPFSHSTLETRDTMQLVHLHRAYA